MISLTPKGNATITSIDCGTPSAQRLGGSIDISNFPDLIAFSGINHDITSFTGNAVCGSNLIKLVLTDNLLSEFPDISANTNLQEFRVDGNEITGKIPNFGTSLLLVRIQQNINLDGPLPSLAGTNINSFYAIGCSLTGNIVLNSSITDYRCDSQRGTVKIGGALPVIPSTLKYFYVYNNDITGFLPDINTNNVIIEFKCGNNLISGTTKPIGGVNTTNLTHYYINDNLISGQILLPTLPNAIGTIRYYNCAGNYITGFMPSNLNSFTNLRTFDCSENIISGSIPALLPPKIVDFNCGSQSGVGLNGKKNIAGILTGFIPQLSTYSSLAVWHSDQNAISGYIPNLPASITDFLCHGNNSITGYIPELAGLTNLDRFNCGSNLISGTIPDLSSNTKLQTFRVYNNSLEGYAGTSLPTGIVNFSVNQNKFPATQIDNILKYMAAASKASGLLDIAGNGNSAPSCTACTTRTNVPGSYFTRNGTLVTVNYPSHGVPNGSLVTIYGANTSFQAGFIGTFVASVTNQNQFTYNTISAGTLNGAGLATIKWTTNTNDGFYSYQQLALVSRQGGPWNVIMN